MGIGKELWQCGPIENVTALLVPVACALWEFGEQAHTIIEGFQESLLPGRAIRSCFSGISSATYRRGDRQADLYKKRLTS